LWVLTWLQSDAVLRFVSPCWRPWPQDDFEGLVEEDDYQVGAPVTAACSRGARQPLQDLLEVATACAGAWRRHRLLELQHAAWARRAERLQRAGTAELPGTRCPRSLPRAPARALERAPRRRSGRPRRRPKLC